MDCNGAIFDILKYIDLYGTDFSFYSEKKRFAPKKDQYQNNEDLSDKEIDDIVDKLELYLGNNEKVNKTFIERGTDLLNDSSSLSELADEIVKTYPEQETSDMNFQETVPSTSNPDIDGIFESSNNNVINMNNISYNIPFGNNKGSNSKSYIVNNIYLHTLLFYILHFLLFYKIHCT